MPITTGFCIRRRIAYYDAFIFKRLRHRNVTRLEKIRLVALLSGNALVSINVVTLRRTRLVLGWVTVCGRVNHLGM